MTNKRLQSVLAALALLACAPDSRAGNPLIWHLYAADPSAHVWPGDDRLWLYTSHDEPGANTHDSMSDYHVFSTTNGVDWIDYGQVLHVKNVKWAVSHAWAIDAVYWKGTYYLVYCMKEKGTGMFRTGLATSPLPQGPFTDIGYIQGVEWGQDPALFVDDGKPYLVWGAGGSCSGAQLADDLKSVVPGTITNLTQQLKYVFEGPWIHKYQGKCYLSYPGLVDGKWPERMFYATADKPLGPYQFKGEYIDSYPGFAGTDHGSIIEYKGRWIAFYHSSWVSGGMSECRNLMADFMDYRPDGSIAPVTPTTNGIAFGVTAAPSRCTIQLEAENGVAAGGSLLETHAEHLRGGFSGSGYVTGFDAPGNAATVLAQVAKPCSARLRIRYLAPDGDETHKVMVNGTLVVDPVHGETSWEKLIVFPKSTEWKTMDLGVIHLREGDNDIKFYAGRPGTIAVDRFEVDPIAP
ncbi:MAG: family 43 glycosylhydrolase [Verrucomicrobiota bacterium]